MQVEVCGEISSCRSGGAKDKFPPGYSLRRNKIELCTALIKYQEITATYFLAASLYKEQHSYGLVSCIDLGARKDQF